MIGSDPVGHGCSNAAKFRSISFDVNVCQRCKELLETEPERITMFVPLAMADYFAESVSELLATMIPIQ